MQTRSYTALAALFIVSTGTQAAIIMIDDFKEGLWSHQMGGFDTYVTHTETGIHPGHSMFKMRTTNVQVTENFFNLPLNIQSGNDAFTVTPTGRQSSWVMRVRYDDQTGQGVDMSHGDQIWVEGNSTWTSGNDLRWGVIDTQGRQGYTGGFTKGNGYYYVRKSSFGSVDWSHISTFIFDVSPNNGESVNVSALMLAPEPGTLVAAGVFLAGLVARRRRAAR